ncbi:TonB-dependent receptor domain-containing protein [Rubrolithibacter danxiaensis]|uniref:TonB-dependent receptor domain-containing protein n=1 Tax=Rubrolithibacter danxiaensis TaxID=3390805 RepID=UPI003BF906E4
MKPKSIPLLNFKFNRFANIYLRIFLCIAAVFLFTDSHAQVPMQQRSPSIIGTISGTVIDSVSGKPLDYATVTLFRENGKAPLNGGLTDEKGEFKISNVSTGNYKLTITFIGYPTKTITGVTTTLSKPDHNLGSIVLSPGANTLNAVVVTGETPIIENKIDKLVFNAEKDVTTTGGNASDVLRKVPMLSVDMDGNVSLRGSQNVKILINGKPSGALSSNVADVLKSMPADQIKNVEVVTSPSAKYDAEGSAGIINIVTKKKNVSGVSGSVSGGLGTRQNNGNFNINLNKNRLSLSANLGVNSGWPQTTNTTLSSQNTALGSSSSSIGTNQSKRLFNMGSASLGYDFNNYNSVSSSISLRGGSFRNDGSSVSSNTTPETGFIEYSAINSNHFALNSFDWNSDYTHKFKKEGEELTLAGQWSHSKVNIDYTSRYTGFAQDQDASNDGKNDEYTVQLDYALPLNKVLKLEAGTKGIFRNISSISNFYNPNEVGEYVLNPLTSNQYDYNQNVYSGYGVLSANFKNGYGIQVGGRLENTEIEGNFVNSSNGSPFKNTYNNFIPSFAVSKKIDNSQTVKLSYSKRIQRPSLQFLNPFRNTSDPLNQSEGNPELSPEVSQSVEFNYSTFIKGSVINASVYYRHTDNIIESYITTIPYTTVDNEGNSVTRNVSLTNFGNIGQNNSIGSSIFGSVTLKKIITLRGSVNLFTYKPETSGTYTQTNDNTYLQYNVFLSGGVKLPSGFAAETFMIQNSPRRTFQGVNPSFNLWTIGLKKEILKKKGSIGLNIVEPFNDRKNFTTNINSGTLTQFNQFSVPFRSVGVNFSWSFGKMNFNQQMPKKKRGINNDDLKQGDNNGQGMQGQ